MTQRLSLVCAAAAGALLASASIAMAHEYIVKPSSMTIKAGDGFTATALSTHVFFAEEELEDAKDSTACFVDGGKRMPIDLKESASKLSYEGTAKAPTDKSFILCGGRKAQLWAKTPAGTKRGTRKEFPNAPLVRSIEKFSKALINASADDDTWSRPIGDRLEIKPKANPATLKIGDELPVQVLFDGKPLATRIFATYAGFSKRDMTFAYYTEMEKADAAPIKITQPGLWIIRVEHIQEDKTEQHDRYDARAVFLFEVKP